MVLEELLNIQVVKVVLEMEMKPLDVRLVVKVLMELEAEAEELEAEAGLTRRDCDRSRRSPHPRGGWTRPAAATPAAATGFSVSR